MWINSRKNVREASRTRAATFVDQHEFFGHADYIQLVLAEEDLVETAGHVHQCCNSIETE